jgi:hypothetical protein
VARKDGASREVEAVVRAWASRAPDDGRVTPLRCGSLSYGQLARAAPRQHIYLLSMAGAPTFWP